MRDAYSDHVTVTIESNIDSLRASAFTDGLHNLVDRLATVGRDFLKTIAPVGETGRLKENVDRSAVVRVGDEFTAEVGVKAVAEAITRFLQAATKEIISPGSQAARDYPLFVDRGTGIFGPAHSPIFARRADFMAFPDEEGRTIFRQRVMGQPGQHFMAKTYAEMLAVLPVHVEEMKARIRADIQPKT